MGSWSGAGRAPSKERLLIASAIVAVVLGALALKWFTAETLNFGPGDLDRFETAPFGSDVPRSTHPMFLTWTRGDGATFFALAIDPDADEEARTLRPSPEYRMSRIGYALLVRTVSLGDEALVPYALTGVNLIAAALITIAALKLRERLGEAALLLLANPAMWIGIAFDTAEPLGLAAGLLALGYWRRPAGILFGALVGVSRPSLATILPASRQGLVSLVAAGFAYLALQAWIVFGLGRDVAFTGGNLDIPLRGYLRAFADMPPASIAVAVFLAAAAVAVAVTAISRRVPTGILVASIATCALVLTLAEWVINAPINLLRATAGLPVVAVIVFAHVRDQRPREISYAHPYDLDRRTHDA